MHELVCGNIFVANLLPNVTSLIQPMDQGIIQNLKHCYRSGFLRKLVNADLNFPKFQSSFNIKDAIYAAALAWKDVKQSTIRSCWLKLWPYVMTEEDDFEGFDDLGTLSADHVERLRTLASHASASHPIHNVLDGEIEEWMHLDDTEPTLQKLTDEAIVSMLCMPTSIAEHESEGEDEKVKVSWKSAQDSLENFIKFMESNSYYNSSEVMTMHILYNKFLTKKASSWKQADLRQMFARAAQCSAPVADDLVPWLTSLVPWLMGPHVRRLAVQVCPLPWNTIGDKSVVIKSKEKSKKINK